MTKLPTAPSTAALNNMNPQQVQQLLTPEMKKSLLGLAENMLAENMINDIQMQSSAPISPMSLPKSSSAQNSPNTAKIQSLPKPHSIQQQQQQQQSAYMTQFQNFSGQQPKKSSSYEISSLLNSQPIPQTQSRIQTSQLPARTPPTPQQDLQLQRPGPGLGLAGLAQMNPSNRVSPMTSIPGITSTLAGSQSSPQRSQHQFNQLVGGGIQQQQQQSLVRQQQQSVVRQQPQQQLQQQQQQQQQQQLQQQQLASLYQWGGF